MFAISSESFSNCFLEVIVIGPDAPAPGGQFAPLNSPYFPDAEHEGSKDVASALEI